MYLLLIISIIAGLLACVEIKHGITKQVETLLKISGISFIGFVFVYVMYYFT